MPNYIFYFLLLKFFKKNNQLDSYCTYYQETRIYLDEYPQQEEIRKDWFERNKYFLYKNRFGQNSIILGYDLSEFTEALTKMAKIGQEIYQKITKDTYFENRWMRRN